MVVKDHPNKADPALCRTADGSSTLFAASVAQTYKSLHGARTEAQTVFLDNSGAASRAATGQPTRILEIGTGTGLNALLTITAFARNRTPLDYQGWERQPLPADMLCGLAYDRLGIPTPLWERWLQTSDRAVESGTVTLAWETARLQMTCTDARRAALGNGYDVVYLDAFSPAAEPEMWQRPWLDTLVATMAPGGVLATYCVAGAFRRRLQALGLHVQRRPGPPGKRQILQATLPDAH